MMKQAEEDRVLDFSGNLPTLSCETFTLKAETVQETQRGLVAWVHVCLDTSQLEAPKGEVQSDRSDLTHVPLPPGRARE